MAEEVYNAGKHALVKDHLGELFKVYVGLWTEGFDNPAEFEMTSAAHSDPYQIDVVAACTKAGWVQLPGQYAREVNVGDLMNVKVI